MLSAVPPDFSAILPEVGLHDADFLLYAQSLGTAAAASWLLPTASEPEV